MKNWDGIVESNDVVIIPGDISWALKFEDAVKDLEWIHERPGKKVLIKGNHDLWWQSVSKLNSLYDDMYFLQNDFFTAGEYAICRTRGWICPGDREFSEHDLKIYRRKILRNFLRCFLSFSCVWLNSRRNFWVSIALYRVRAGNRIPK